MVERKVLGTTDLNKKIGPCGQNLHPCLKIVLPVTSDVGNLFSEFERCVIFRFRVNGGHGTDGQTDGLA